MRLLRILLFPFAILYDLTTRFRNHLYDIQYKKSFKFDTVVINVGNLSVGGTGKTPMIEYLITLLMKEFKVSTLSRGYGRKTKGFRLLTREDSAVSAGDEPYQFYLKFNKDIQVAVGEERALAIPEILYHAPETEVILLDDAFQHRSVKPQINLLLSDYQQPFYNDYVIPAGRLREARQGAKRADIILVTKCPEINEQSRNEIKKKINLYSKSETPIFFTRIHYNPPQKIIDSQNFPFTKNVVLFTGIANSQPLEDHVKKHYTLIKHISFSDHYDYSAEDMEKLKGELICRGNQNTSLLTTEKDMVKLLHPAIKPLIEKLPIFYIPIAIEFIQDQALFEKELFNSIRKIKDGFN